MRERIFFSTLFNFVAKYTEQYFIITFLASFGMSFFFKKKKTCFIFDNKKSSNINLFCHSIYKVISFFFQTNSRIYKFHLKLNCNKTLCQFLVTYFKLRLFLCQNARFIIAGIMSFITNIFHGLLDK